MKLRAGDRTVMPIAAATGGKMQMRLHNLVIVPALAMLVLAAGVRGECVLRLERVASGFSRPIGLVHPGDGSGRVFILEQHTGRIRILYPGRGLLIRYPIIARGALVSISLSLCPPNHEFLATPLETSFWIYYQFIVDLRVVDFL